MDRRESIATDSFVNIFSKKIRQRVGLGSDSRGDHCFCPIAVGRLRSAARWRRCGVIAAFGLTEKRLSFRLALIPKREHEDLATSNQPRIVASKTTTSSSLIMSNRFNFLVASTCLVMTALTTSFVSADIAGLANCPRR